MRAEQTEAWVLNLIHCRGAAIQFMSTFQIHKRKVMGLKGLDLYHGKD